MAVDNFPSLAGRRRSIQPRSGIRSAPGLRALPPDRAQDRLTALNNNSGVETSVEAFLVETSDIWDYRANPGALAHTTLKVLPGGRMQRYLDGVTPSFRVEPPQRCYSPGNILSNVTRPHRFTNLWRSDPAQPLFQWIELAWPKPQRLISVQTTFAGNLIHKPHLYPPHHRDPQCLRDYILSAGDRELLRQHSGKSVIRRYSEGSVPGFELSSSLTRCFGAPQHDSFNACAVAPSCHQAGLAGQRRSQFTSSL